MINSLRCVVLDTTERGLVDQFYRAHGSPMKTKSAHTVWSVRDDRLHACLCLQPVAHGHWLTGLFVTPALRNMGLAGRLITAARASVSGPVWLFCNPDLERLYARYGFQRCAELPQQLCSKLERYQRSKPLIALYMAQ